MKATGGPSATAAKYSQLRADDAPSATNTNITSAIQHADTNHRVCGVDMKPGFLQGFDEADRGKDVQRVSVQESSALRVYASERGATRKIAPHRSSSHERRVDGMLYSESVTALLNTAA